MALKMKTFNSILNDMANWVKSNTSSITNFRIGSVSRTLLEAVSVELESLYLQMHRGFKFCIENSIYHSFDFQKLPATPSSGDLTIEFIRPTTENIIIPQGYRFCTQMIDDVIVYFEVTKETIIPYGVDKALLRVQCTEGGVIGNVPSYSITRAVVQMPFIKTIYNENPFSNGLEEELTEDRKARFTKYINTLAKGTKEALKYGCLKTPGVAGVYVEERIGHVNIYVHDGGGELSPELKAKVEDNIIDYKAAGIQVSVLPITKKYLDLVLDVKLAPGFNTSDYSNLIQSSVISFLNKSVVAKSVTMAELIRHVMNLDSNSILNVNLSISEDVPVQNHELIRAGTITVNIV